MAGWGRRAVGDGLALAGAYAAVAALRHGLGARFGSPLPPLPLDAAWLPGVLCVGTFALSAGWLGPPRRPGRALAESLRAAAIATPAAALAAFLLRVEVNRTLLVGYAVAAVLTLAARRAWVASTSAPRRIAVIGDPVDATPLAAALARAGDEVVVVDAGSSVEVLLAVGGNGAPVDELHLTGTWTPEALHRVAEACAANDVPLHIDARFLGMAPVLAHLTEVDGWAEIRLDRVRSPSVAKRVIDVVVGGLALVLAVPVLVAAGAAIAALDGRPVLFVQTRLGQFGRPFRMYKLRTMVPGSDPPGPRPLTRKRTADPRVTRLGALLRRTSIDELPQLLNVLRGEMSLVGPRPPIPAEAEAYAAWQWRRLVVPPGMTGLWQVSGRGDLAPDEGIALDLAYVDRWSPWLDLHLLVRTLPAVVRGTGAR